jgi:transcription elongation GreA/GreB family factor
VNKKELIAIFTARLEEDAQILKEAARATAEAATNEESKPENQYDTRALEASYLAGAQAHRVREISEVIGLFRTLTFKDFTDSDKVQSTALVSILLDGKKNRLLVMPKGGGVSLQYEKETVQIVTPASSLGETILGMSVGDSAEFEVGSKVRTVEVLSIV